MSSFGFSRAEISVLRPLNTPRKVQDFLETIPINFEPGGDTCLSPRRVLRERRAHCIEGAMVAALALHLHGHPPLLLDLESSSCDLDHVVAPFRLHGRWGAISKTNHAVLRYREPVYATIRELVLSYFHEYFDASGRKTLRRYSRPYDLRRCKTDWATSEEDVWEVPGALCDLPHLPILTRPQIAGLRRADLIERKAGDLTEYRHS